MATKSLNRLHHEKDEKETQNSGFLYSKEKTAPPRHKAV